MQAHGTLLPSLYKVEEELCRKIGLKPDSEFQTKLLGPVIAIGGLSGVGKDTLAAGIQKEFKLSFNRDLFVFSAGTLMRESARQLGYDEAHLDKFLTKFSTDKGFSKRVDHYIDQHMLEQVLTNGRGIFLGRMSPFAVGAWGFTVWMTADLAVIAARIIKDPNRAEYGFSVQEIYEKLQRRDQTDRERLENAYSIKLDDLAKKANLIIDNSHTDASETRRQILRALRSFYHF